MNKIFDFSQTADEAALALQLQPGETAMVHPSMHIEEAEEILTRRLNNGWRAAACSVPYLDEKGNTVSLPALLIVSKI